MTHSCYLGDVVSFDTVEELWEHMIKIHDKRPSSKDTLNNGKVQRAIFEKAGIVDLEKLT